MALTRVKTWTSEVLTSSDLNAEFNNILNNALSLISPLTASLAAGGFDITGVDEIGLDNAATDASAAGRLRRNVAALTWHDGTAARTIPMVLNRDVAVATVSNTTTATDVYSFSVPASTLLTNRRLRLELDGVYLNNSGASRNLTFAITFDSTTVGSFSVNTIPASASDRYYKATAFITGFNSASSQDCQATFMLTGAGATQIATDAALNPSAFLQLATLSKDSTGALTLAVTVTHSAANANLSITCRTAILELL